MFECQNCRNFFFFGDAPRFSEQQKVIVNHKKFGLLALPQWFAVTSLHRIMCWQSLHSSVQFCILDTMKLLFEVRKSCVIWPSLPQGLKGNHRTSPVPFPFASNKEGICSGNLYCSKINLPGLLEQAALLLHREMPQRECSNWKLAGFQQIEKESNRKISLELF